MNLPASRARPPDTVDLHQLHDFDEIIDVRSQSEFAEDHIPGAINCPVLDDVERARIGTLYKQMSAFDAKKAGAALVAANIARHLTERFQDRPRQWRPLIYCWRGGGRSGALSHVMRQIGWRAARLDGGYKAYRRAVIAELETLPGRLSWRVVCGMTGTGKSRLLAALAEQGAQVLDLEALAAHRGSVLGNLPGEAQPSQKRFESAVWHHLRRFDVARPVYVESESKKIGALRVPETLIAAMWTGTPLVLQAPMDVRIDLLKDDYAHFLQDIASLSGQLDCLVTLHGRDVIAYWKSLAAAGEWNALTEALLVRHYDPAYTRAITRHYPALAQAPVVTAIDSSADHFRRLAKNLLVNM